MSAGESLSGGQFGRLFHGSVSDLKGSHLTPGGFGGASGGQDEWKHLGQSKNDYVSATDDESKAWQFAHLAAGQGLRDGRPRVYEVEPNPDTKIGIEHIDHPTLKRAYEEQWWKKPNDNREHVAPSFKVLAQHDTRPGAQGTFPSVDWRPYATGVAKSRANHPASARPQYDEHEAEAYREQRKRRIAERQAKRTESKPEGLF